MSLPSVADVRGLGVIASPLLGLHHRIPYSLSELRLGVLFNMGAMYHMKLFEFKLIKIQYS